MNAKMAKKLRWYARVQESMMPPPEVNSKGVSSLLLVYEYPKQISQGPGGSGGGTIRFTNRTIMYNPRKSGKGFYRVLKKRKARLAGEAAGVRLQCQTRIIELLTAKANDGRPRPAPEIPDGVTTGPGNVV